MLMFDKYCYLIIKNISVKGQYTYKVRCFFLWFRHSCKRRFCFTDIARESFRLHENVDNQLDISDYDNEKYFF